MATAQEIAERALAIAGGFLGESREEIMRMAGGDGSLLYQASQIVRRHADAAPASTHSQEHLAFSLIMAAHERLREQAHPERSEPPRN